ncbi:MAG: transglutaminase N-terminal domain-containing protein, partial [Armatimonadota bacterium]
MRLEIRHLTRYDYSEPVLLEPQVLRLRPQNNANQRVLAFDFSVEPQPAGHSVLVDLNDTDVISVWFNGPADSLAISIESTIETLRSNPFDYLWEGAKLLPMTYSAA